MRQGSYDCSRCARDRRRLGRWNRGATGSHSRRPENDDSWRESRAPRGLPAKASALAHRAQGGADPLSGIHLRVALVVCEAPRAVRRLLRRDRCLPRSERPGRLLPDLPALGHHGRDILQRGVLQRHPLAGRQCGAHQEDLPAPRDVPHREHDDRRREHGAADHRRDRDLAVLRLGPLVRLLGRDPAGSGDHRFWPAASASSSAPST